MQSFNPSYHITGNYPLREADTDDQTEPCFAVQIPCGFETHDIAVYGHGLCESDAEEAAREWMERLDWFSGEPDTSSWIVRRVKR